jgi:hypothetical protein
VVTDASSVPVRAQLDRNLPKSGYVPKALRRLLKFRPELD